MLSATMSMAHLHNEEFTMLEWYRCETDYTGIMAETEQLLYYLLHQFSRRYRGHGHHIIPFSTYKC